MIEEKKPFCIKHCKTKPAVASSPAKQAQNTSNQAVFVKPLEGIKVDTNITEIKSSAKSPKSPASAPLLQPNSQISPQQQISPITVQVSPRKDQQKVMEQPKQSPKKEPANNPKSPVKAK